MIFNTDAIECWVTIALVVALIDRDPPDTDHRRECVTSLTSSILEYLVTHSLEPGCELLCEQFRCPENLGILILGKSLASSAKCSSVSARFNSDRYCNPTSRY